MQAKRRVLWEPAVYEHKAALIGRPVAEVAASAELLTQALLAEHEAYGADFLTVGLDVYNVEAEACGAEVVAGGPSDCPEIPRPPLDLSDLPRELALPPVPAAGRFGVLLEAGRKVRDELAGRCAVRVAASGPVSIAAKLAGLEPLLMGLALGQEAAGRLLEFATRLAEAWCRCLRATGLDAIVFDSVAAPPIISPNMYEGVVLPLHRRVMGVLAEAGQTQRPLIVGGDTAPIAAHLAASGATMLICDFPTDAGAFAAALGESGQPVVRRNVNPALFAREDRDALAAASDGLVRDLAHFSRPVAGTGILPYDTDPQRVRDFRRMLDKLS